MKLLQKKIVNSQYFISVACLLLAVIISALIGRGSFLQFDNFITIARQASILLLFSAGLTAVVLTGGIDLSVGNTAALVGCITAMAMKQGAPIAIAILLGLLTGCIIGAFNGVLVGILRLAPFIATYGTSMVVLGISTIVMQGSVINGLPAQFTQLGIGYVGPIPIPIIIAIVVVILLYIILQKTIFGRKIYLIGCNSEAAKYSAINDVGMTIAAYALCGLSAAIGGIILTARLNAAEAAMGDVYGLQVVAAVVMGGTSLLGGEGGIVGTLVGSLILTIITNIMNIAGISPLWQKLAVGIVIILMVWLDIFTRAQREKKSRV